MSHPDQTKTYEDDREPLTIMEQLDELLALTKKLQEDLKELPTISEMVSKIAEATVPPNPNEL